MADILLSSDGDILIGENGDIQTTESILQAVKIHLKWIYGEWIFGPELGLTWFEDILVKNPNLVKIRSVIRSTIVDVPGVTDATIESIDFNKELRTASIKYICYVGKDRYNEEVILYG